MRSNRKTRRRAKFHTITPKPERKKEKKTLAQMSDEELRAMIHQLEYDRIKLPNYPTTRMVNLRESYTKRIDFLWNMLDNRKGMTKKDETDKN